MKITEKEKKILFIAASLLLVVCAFIFGFKNISSKNEEMNTEISNLNKKYNNLKMMSLHADEYAENTKMYNEQYDEVVNSYDTGYSQEYSIMFLKEIENETGVWLSQAGFAATEQIFTFGGVPSTNPSKEGAKAYSSDFIGYKTTMTLSYQTSYENFKKVIDFINTYKYKCTIDSITSTYNADADIVSGSMVLTQYAITGTDREFDGAKVNSIMNGTENIFSSSIFSAGVSGDTENGNNIISDYDCYITLQSDKSDLDAFIIGCKNDSDQSTILKSNTNDFKNVEVRFFGKNGDYYVQYKVGSVTYPAAKYSDGASIVPGNLLSLLVVSSERADDNDLSGANVSLINETDMVLYVKVVNEDINNPRFVINNKQGEIVIFE